MTVNEFDAAGNVEDAEDVAAILNAAIEMGGTEALSCALETTARSKDPSFDTVLKVVDALGYRLRIERKPKDAASAVARSE